MTISLQDNAIPATSASHIGTFELQNTEKSAAEGPAFAQVISAMWQAPPTEGSNSRTNTFIGENPDGQSLADADAPSLNPWMPGHEFAVMAMNLSPHMNIITAQTPPPDGQSLEAFARSQGLDEAAVHWLFGAGSGGSSPVPGPATSAPLAGQSAPLSMMPTPFSVPETGTPTTSVNLSVATQTAFVTAAAQGILNSSEPSASPNQIGINVKTAESGFDLAAAQAILKTSEPSASPNQIGIKAKTAESGFGLAAAQAILKTSEPSGFSKAQGTASKAVEAEAEGIPLNLLRMPPPAAVWMQRSALPQLQNPTAHPEKTTGPSVSELDLGADWVADLDILSLDSPASAPNGASTTGTHGSAYANFAARWDAQAPLKTDTSLASSTPPPASTNLSETIQNLADKMGQAIGQRILSEMEKGQWHLKLQLRPATLGHIEVEMRMRSGEFDAVFTAPHHLTRDLLQDGMNRLKDTLSQMGMDVASIHVQDGQTGQRGGDSTPGTFGGKTKEDAKTVENVAEMPPLQTVKMSSDGLDILV